MKITFTPRNMAVMLFKRKKALGGFFGVCVALTAIYVAISPYKYESDATVIVNLNTRDLADLGNDSTRQVTLSADLAKDVVDSQISILTSLDVRRAVLEKLGVDKVYPTIARRTPLWGTPMDSAIERLGKDLTVKAPVNSMVLEIALLNQDPSIAQSALRALLDAFFERQARISRNPRTDFVQQQLQAARLDVDKAQKAYLDYREQESISSLDDERLQLLKERTDQEELLYTAKTELADAEQQAATLQAALAQTPEVVTLTNENDRTLHEVDDAQTNLTNVEARYRQASQTYTDTNPLLADERENLRAARARLAQIREGSASRPRTGPNPVYQNLTAAVTGAAAKLNALRPVVDLRATQLEELNRRLDHLDSAEGKLLDLRRELDVAAENYQTYLQRTTEARVAEDLNRASITSLGLAQASSLPFEPARPRVLLLLALSIVIGAIGGVGLCLTLEILDETITLPEQIEPLLGLPVLVALGNISGGKGRG
jgi:succinoglycan biosynthesis transport protein ExoP